jgi:polyribonucleotide nucleotidyltransferase
VILTDIAGEEDHNGDMDFKVSGTSEGITAMQMDVKIQGLSREIMEQALHQAREARLHVLECMTRTLDKPREALSRHAPRIVTIQINPDKIRDVIGPLGKNIRYITETTGTKINVEDDGIVKIAATSAEALEKAIELVKESVQEAEEGAVYTGKVKKVVDFGAFVEILPGIEGLLHISELSHERVRQVSDVVNVGEEVQVKVLQVEPNGRIKLSRRALLPRDEGMAMGQDSDRRRKRSNWERRSGHDRGRNGRT